MDNPYATILLTTASLGSFATAALTAWVAVGAKRISATAAGATVEQAKATGDAVRAADAAAATAETVARIELDRRHDEMFPDVSVEYRWETNPRTLQGNLFAYVTSRSRRDYRVEAEKTWDGGATQTVSAFTLGAGQTHRAYIGDTIMKLPTGFALEFDAVDPCPCPRRTKNGQHWLRGFAIDAPELSTTATTEQAGNGAR